MVLPPTASGLREAGWMESNASRGTLVPQTLSNPAWTSNLTGIPIERDSTAWGPSKDFATIIVRCASWAAW